MSIEVTGSVPLQELEKYILEAEDERQEVQPYYVEHADEVIEVTCLQHNGVIALEVKMPDSDIKPRRDGLILIPFGQLLLSSRLRSDGTMGYSCACGNNDILLPEEHALGEKKAMLPHIKAQIDTALAERSDNESIQLFRRVKV